MIKITVEDIKNAVKGTNFDFYGVRVDGSILYHVGDTANNSRQLFQDPDFDDGELIYPYIEDGVNKGLYDAGELDGTCTIGFCPDDDIPIAAAIKQLKCILAILSMFWAGTMLRVEMTEFQSTLPHTGSDFLGGDFICYKDISIHTPHTGSDTSASIL